jgi:hypothetical protein
VEVNFLVRVYAKDGKEEKFDGKAIEADLKAAGLPERVAKEVTDRVEARAEEGWTTDRIKQETSVELRRLQEDIDRAYINFKSSGSMGDYNVGEQRTASDSEYSSNDSPRKETMVECRNVED